MTTTSQEAVYRRQRARGAGLEVYLLVRQCRLQNKKREPGWGSQVSVSSVTRFQISNPAGRSK